MANRTFACFRCRTTARAPGWRTDVVCRACGRPAWWVSHKIEIPRRSDERGWRALREPVMTALREARTQRVAWLKTRRDDLVAARGRCDPRNRVFAADLDERIAELNAEITRCMGW